MKFSKSRRRRTIQNRIRKKIKGTGNRPRLSIFRSNKEIYVQVIDDLTGTTLVSASSREADIAKQDGNKTAVAKEVGKLIAERVKAENIERVVFDRGGYLYHGRVKALADGAREGGLVF